MRFLPEKAGHYFWETKGIIQVRGEEECAVSEENHGMVKAKDTHFEFQDGRKYIPFGTTIYALAHQPQELIEQTLKSLGESPERIAYLKELLYSLPSNLTPWQEPIWEEFSNVTEEKGDESKVNPFMALMQSLGSEEREMNQLKSNQYNGCCGNDVFLKYYARQCAKTSLILLPKDVIYKIEVIDVWNMTRETLTEEASGRTILELPGKEGIAVLATKISSC